MARIRSIKPEFWVSEQVAECSPSARLTFIGLWNFCDDNGVHPAKPKTLKACLYPMDDVSAANVAAWIDELVRVGLVAVFHANGETYWHVTGWVKHQKIDRPSAKYPVPPAPNSATTRRAELASPRRDILDDDSSNARQAPPPGVEGKGEERRGVEGDSPKAHAAPARKSSRKTTLPNNFGISERVRSWAGGKGFGDLEAHLEAFVNKAMAKGYTYADWDEGFMGAIRDDWAKVRTGHAGQRRAASVLHADDNLSEVAR